jgi:hypothetical protein
VKTKFFILAVVAIIMIAIATFVLRGRSNETAVWQELFQHLPARPLTPAEIQITDEAVSARMTPENDEVGHIQLANGDIWRFAFRSHHLVGGPDSFSVFAGPPGVFRVRGDYFCCEVQLPNGPPPKDSAEFLAFLRHVHNSVEHVK